MKQHFTFVPQKLALKDIGQNIEELLKISDNLTEASSFKLIQSALSSVSITVVEGLMQNRK